MSNNEIIIEQSQQIRDLQRTVSELEQEANELNREIIELTGKNNEADALFALQITGEGNDRG